MPRPKKQTKLVKQTTNTTYQTLSIILGCALIASLCGLVYCAANMKTAEEQEYLVTKDFILTRLIKEMYEQDDHWQACDFVSSGISSDGDLMARFWCQDIDTEAHELIGDKAYRTLYFLPFITLSPKLSIDSFTDRGIMY